MRLCTLKRIQSSLTAWSMNVEASQVVPKKTRASPETFAMTFSPASVSVLNASGP